jgi:hypothetical protein
VQRLAHRPADDLAGMQIQYGGEVKPAFAGGDVSQVAEPNLAGSTSDKVAAEPVGCDRVGVPTIRRSRSTASRLKTSGNTRRVVLIRHLPLGSKA